MKPVPTKRFRSKNGKFLLVAVIAEEKALEELPDTQSVIILARRDLIWLQRNLDGKRHSLFKQKVVSLLDSIKRDNLNARSADQS